MRFHIIETLCGVLACETLNAFQLDHQNVFDNEIGTVFSD